MKPISDALELLTAQHEQIDDLLAQVQRTRDPRMLALLVDKVAAHLAIEQTLFYPAVAPAIAPHVLDELLLEHVAIKRALAEVVWLGVDEPDLAIRLDQLAALLAGHAGWQEEELFVEAAETMTPDMLADLGHRLQALDVAFPIAA